MSIKDASWGRARNRKVEEGIVKGSLIESLIERERKRDQDTDYGCNRVIENSKSEPKKKRNVRRISIHKNLSPGIVYTYTNNKHKTSHRLTYDLEFSIGCSKRYTC